MTGQLMPRSFQRFQKSILSLLALAVLCSVPQVEGAVTLTGTSYTQNFDSIGSGLPADWTVRTGATTTALGTARTLTTAATSWGDSGGSFKNLAAAGSFLSNASNANQAAATDRALGVRQTGSFGDPGASFNFHFNASAVTFSSLSLDLMMLNVQPRSTTWSIQYGIGATPTSWTTLSTWADPGSFGTTNFSFDATDLAALNGQAAAWIRIVALGGSSGGGNRDTMGIDNFTFNFSSGPPPSDSLYFLGDDAALGGVGTWAASGGTAWAPNADGTGTAQAWDASKIARFNSASTVGVTGTIDLNQGIQITADTTLSGGTLNMAAASQAQNVWNVGTATTATVSSEITGSNGITKTGNGTLILTGTKTYAGGTTVSGGTLQLGDGTTNGSVAGNVTNNANLTFNNGSTQSFGGEISGSGSLTKIGAGALTLSGSNSYNGGTTVSAGSLIGTTSSLQGAIVNNAAVTFDQSGNGTYAGNMSGSGSLTKLGAGVVTLSGTNSYSGGTTVSAGGLIGTTASLQGGIVNNAAVTFDQTTNGTYSGDMSGSGSLTKLGAGVVTLSGSNSYGGGTTVSAGGLVGTTDSLQGAITNDAAVTFNQTTDGTYAGIMTGTGSFTKSGSGAVTLSGGSDYSGGTTVAAGKLIGAHNTAFGTNDITLTGGSLLAGTAITIANDIVVNVVTSPQLLITQYYEGPSTNKWIEITNIGGATIDLAAGDFYLGHFNNANAEGYKTDVAANFSMALTGTLTGGQSLLLGNTGNTTPTYASADVNNNSVINFNGNDSIVLYTGATFASANIVDAIGFTNSGNEGVDKSFVRLATAAGYNLTAGSDVLDFASVWNQVTMATVDAATAGTDERLGYSSLVGGGASSAILGSEISSGTATFSGNITLDSNVHLTADAGGTSRFTGIIANGSNGARGIEKIGAGRVDLTGANTYSGPTTVTAGTLAVNNTTGSGTGTGNVLVKDTAVLAGAGTLSPASGGSIVFESGSTVSVGNAGDTVGQQLSFIPDSGTITTTFSSGSVLEFDLFSNVGNNTSLTAAADRLFLNGSAIFQSNVTLRVNTLLDSLQFVDGDRWTLFDWTSLSITGNANDLELELPTLSATLSWDTSQLFAAGSVGVIIIPEPTRVSLILLAGLALALRRRRAAR
jgi:autotransporter-associated beta strand protein